MAHKDTFCNSPWYELHIYWDGSYGYCCTQIIPPYDLSEKAKYNVANMTIAEWYDSAPMRDTRLLFHTDIKNTKCSTCWIQEESSGTSKRYRNNQKSVIFQKQNFYDSYEQSPGFEKFKYSLDHDGKYNGMPIDIHIDLGNHCNLACKMCGPHASSKIAAQMYKWGELLDKSLIATNWTKDQQVWDRFLAELIKIPDLKSIHFMGGETLITPRFHDFIDYFINHKRFDVSFSFVTNGTVFDETLFDKLSMFERVGIEVSIETTTKHNEYIRQGTSNTEVFQNIERMYNKTNGNNITLTLRPAVSLLSIGTYYTLLEYAINNKLTLKALPVQRPEYLKISVLPKNIRNSYKENYYNLLEKYDFSKSHNDQDYNESNHNEYMKVIAFEIEKAIFELDRPDHPNQNELLARLVSECNKWDKIYNLNMKTLYPEFCDFYNESI